jgi:hypothetical protein
MEGLQHEFSQYDNELWQRTGGRTVTIRTLAPPRPGMSGSDRRACRPATGDTSPSRRWLLALISTSGAVVLGVKKQVATYVVEVDKAGCRAGSRWPAPVSADAAQVGYFVGEVVRLVRERPLDPVVMRQQWTKAYQFLAGQAVNGMNEYAASDTG